MNIHTKNTLRALAFALSIVLFTACGSSDKKTLSTQDIALGHIQTYAANNGTGDAPTLQDYLDANVTGITESNLVEINEVVGNLNQEEVDTPEEIQALVNELGIASTPVGSTPVTSTPTTAGTVTTPCTGGCASTPTCTTGCGTTTVPTPTPTPTPKDTTPPIFTSSPKASINENQLSAITLATKDISAVTYRLSGTDAGSFRVDARTGVVKFKVAPDFETKTSYTFVAIATDASSNTSKQTIVITILDVNETVTIIHNGTTYGTVTSPTGRVWLDRNLGAARVCTSFDDTACYGDYYQWGRNADGHEDSASDMYRVTSLQIKPGHRDFIIGVDDWISRRVDDNGVARIKNWSSVDGSSICPVGFRVPTVQEIKKDTLDATTKVTNSATAFENFLKLPSAGYRKNSNGDFQNLGNNNGLSGGIWAVSPVNRSFSPSIYFTKDDAGKFDSYRATGHSIRCIKH